MKAISDAVKEIKKEIEELEWEQHCVQLKIDKLQLLYGLLDNSGIDSGYGPDEDEYWAARGRVAKNENN